MATLMGALVYPLTSELNCSRGGVGLSDGIVDLRRFPNFWFVFLPSVDFLVLTSLNRVKTRF